MWRPCLQVRVLKVDNSLDAQLSQLGHRVSDMKRPREEFLHGSKQRLRGNSPTKGRDAGAVTKPLPPDIPCTWEPTNFA